MDNRKPGTRKGYRPDIDGLRAVAVLAVVMFHSHLHFAAAFVRFLELRSGALAQHFSSGLTGGFIGVDVFFVISGFLIGGILLREQADGTFSLVRFYERRVRRIVPALTVVMLFTFFAGWYGLALNPMEGVGKSMLAATFSVANIYFLHTISYFKMPVIQEPLLHTWSLAVEEQFYLVVPVMLMAIRRFGSRYLKIILLILFSVSFAASEVGVYRSPESAFYLAHTRAWELLLGTMLAAGVFPTLKTAVGRNLASAAGLAGIVFASIALTETTKFPGAAALWPCVGAALIIAAGETGSSAVGRLLSTVPAVFVGSISYSLYLWHWPLIVINTFGWFGGAKARNILLLPVIFAVATLSWLLVERPFRTGPMALSRGRLFAVAASATLVVSALAGWSVWTKGLPQRLTGEEIRLLDQATRSSKENGAYWGSGCFAWAGTPVSAASCLEESRVEANYLLYGDSTAAHLMLGLEAAYPNVHWLEVTGASCPPLLSSLESPAEFCRAITDKLFNYFVPSHKVDAIFLSGHIAAWQANDLKAAIERLRPGAGKIYVIGPLPSYDQPLPELLVRSLRTGDHELPQKHLSITPEEGRLEDKQLGSAAREGGADGYMSMFDLLCGGSSCIEYTSPGLPLQWDTLHLSREGSLLVGRAIHDSHMVP